MRVAILHDYLNQYGGAERVLEAILEMYPAADIYTLLYDGEKTRGAFAANIAKTSFLDIPFIRRRHRLFIPFMPLAAKFLKSKERYDLVISSTAGYGKGIGVTGRYHVSYCHTPLRYAWEFDYLKDVPFSPWPVKEGIMRPIARALRRWDERTAGRVNVFMANSRHIQGKIRAYYKRDAIVVYPPVDTKLFYPERERVHEPYYLMAGRLLYYKRFDLGIRAFNEMKRRLVVVGKGPEYANLAAMADARYIRFVPSPDDAELRRIYSNAEAFIFPQVEDFGLVAAEALACGTPVIAYKEGGGGEIVSPKRTGVIMREQTSAAVIAAVREAERTQWNRKAIAAEAEKFSKEAFKRNFEAVLASVGFPNH